MEAQQNKMEFFCKLGYGKGEVHQVLAKLGQGASENDLLKELIQMGSRPHEPQQYWTQCLHPRPAAHGSCRTSPSFQQSTEETWDPSSNLRPIVIDGSNIAMSHGNKEVFSCLGIQLVVDWFKNRGHKYIKAFVPSWRKESTRFDTPITDQHVLEQLAKQAILVYTPSRKMKGKRLVCYDDRYIVKLAYEQDGIIVSNDNFRDLQNENPEWKWFIEQRLLMYSFVNDKFMPPDDPLGRHGPSLDNFLSIKPMIPGPKWQLCPYDKKCTYGIKCKFFHPERLNCDQLSVADELRANTKAYLLIRRTEEEMMNKNGTTSNSVGPRGGSMKSVKCSSAAAQRLIHTTTPQWAREDTRGSESTNIHRSNQQVSQQCQTKQDEDLSTQLSVLTLSAKRSSGNMLASPGSHEDRVHDWKRAPQLKYNHSRPVPPHSQCLDCPCLEGCYFQRTGVCKDGKVPRLWSPSELHKVRVPAAQTSQIPCGFVKWDLKSQHEGQYCAIASSAKAFSYSKYEDMTHPGKLQAKFCDQLHLLDSSSFRAGECYTHPSGTKRQQTLPLCPLCGMHAHVHQPPGFACPYNGADHVLFSSSMDLFDSRSLQLLVQKNGNM